MITIKFKAEHKENDLTSSLRSFVYVKGNNVQSSCQLTYLSVCLSDVMKLSVCLYHMNLPGRFGSCLVRPISSIFSETAKHPSILLCVDAPCLSQVPCGCVSC